MSMAVCSATLPASFCMGPDLCVNFPAGTVFPVAAPPDVHAQFRFAAQQQHEAAYQKRKQEGDDSHGDGDDDDDEEEKGDGQFDIWNSIQESKKKAAAAATTDDLPPPYIHPLLRRSSSFLSQKSLEICTESLGSETGSDGFSDHCFPSESSDEEYGTEEPETHEEIVDNQEGFVEGRVRKELAVVNYHCSMSRKSPVRSFPPPLPSISRRDGPCLHMRPHRRNGRLVVQAVPVPSRNYLHCERQDGRLLLSFIETTFEEIYPEMQTNDQNQQEEEEEEGADEEMDEGVDDRGLEGAEDQMEEGEGDEMVEEEEEEEEGEVAMEEEEEEVEVVDRGIVVEVKVSRQPQLQTGGFKVHRSSLVINKFVGGTAVAVAPSHDTATEPAVTIDVPKTTAAATDMHEMDLWGNIRKSSSRALVDGDGGQQRQQNHGGSAVQDSKLLFSTKRMMKRQDMLHQVRRCSQNQRSLFIWEPCCIATT